MVDLVNRILDDYEEYCGNILASEFINYKPSKQGSILEYHRYKYRIVSTRHRKVAEANDLYIPEHHLSAYTEIVNDITNGMPLKKYQSRNLKNINYDDDMLSHWRIQHFHLGSVLEKDGFVKRTKELLFIFFTKQKAYILGVFSHGAWCDLDIIEIIHQNWPNELMRYKSENTGKVLTADEYKILRHRNYNTTIAVKDGTEYFGPGLGVMLGGSPVEAVTNVHRLMMIFERDFENIGLNIDQILNAGEVNKTLEGTATIGWEIDHTKRNFIYKIYETGFRFTLEI